MLDEGSHIGNRSSGNNNHLTKLRRSVDSKASILNLQLRELSADDDPKGTPVAVFQQRRTHAQQQKRKYPKEIRHYLYPHLLYHPGFYFLKNYISNCINSEMHIYIGNLMVGRPH
jgi:hypothetical protein